MVDREGGVVVECVTGRERERKLIIGSKENTRTQAAVRSHNQSYYIADTQHNNSHHYYHHRHHHHYHHTALALPYPRTTLPHTILPPANWLTSCLCQGDVLRVAVAVYEEGFLLLVLNMRKRRKEFILMSDL